ncbi:hypothetical protein HU200_022758 [Digitaria exilis]|uniref:Serpin domain-containing protein n=1 Tax=Digitaria exilis TaxID=1010633 RepID=A0A835C472_9POAL|nr:hypothetical protein HU200_022758 [Digitaria exilis]
MRLSIAHQIRFALCLYAALNSSPSATPPSNSNNVVFSPLSIHVALGRLLAAGAGGATRNQLLAALAGGGGAADRLQALGEEINPAFEEVALKKYNADIHSVDFQNKAEEVPGRVNSWVEKVTSGRIKDLLQPGSVDKDTMLILANALYFKGAWAKKFDVSKTEDSEFHLLDGSSVQAPFMSSGDDQYIASYNHFKVLKLPYQQGGDKRQFSMYILLLEAQDGLWSLAEKLSSEPEFLDKHIPVSKIPVGQMKVPKFKISYGFEASEMLKGLGLGLPFSAEADLSELVDAPARQKKSVSSVIHKSFVEVNEGGTEAAAASAIRLMGSALYSSPSKTTDFIADHPFLFWSEKTRVVWCCSLVMWSIPYLQHNVFALECYLGLVPSIPCECRVLTI